jgi:hypothetical protein
MNKTLLILAAVTVSRYAPCPAITPAELDRLIPALIQVESGGEYRAVGDHGKAVGILQIHAEYVQDVNRIAGTHYTLRDRLDRQKSIDMTRIYLAHYGKGKTIEQTARVHNGGPAGHKKQSTVKYWNKVRKELK